MANSRPDPYLRAIREVRRATRDYLVVLDAALEVFSESAVRDRPEFAYIRTALRIASGTRGANSYSFASAANIERLLTRALGESTT